MPEPASAEAESTSRDPPAYRLVIRAQIVSDPIPDAPTSSSSNKRVLALAAAAIALAALGWLGIVALKTEPAAPTTSAPVTRATPPTVAIEVAPSQPAPVADVPLQSVDQVTPSPSAGALQTIRGTIRVAIRVTIDPQGRVIEAVEMESGPSRYFVRLSNEAARKWTFTQSNTATTRSALLRFHFTRKGATAELEG